ncbi:DedA family protein [Cohnella zeiphila]|uniref:DedA family protein n=1 Tax=Cohnella zeiphila TaxID=2761120 RepID=A0A7X0SPW1_9BACL|nr:DedA family protein [Cohnella zeiphila]MBB6733811.1 DedA family protein [Cohnella zeiphila]
MEQWIVEWMDRFGYAGVFLLITLENVFPPIPSEIVLTFGGFMTTYSDLGIAGVILFSTLGSLAGALILYYIGFLFDQARMERIVGRWGRWLRLTPSDVRKTYRWFGKYGVWAVFLCRLVPLLRSLISIPAGSTRMNVWLFALLTTLGSLIWNAALVGIGAAVGSSWESILTYMDLYSHIVYALLALALLVVAVLLFRKKRAARAD